MCAIQIGQKVPVRPTSTNSVSSGMSVTWMGTICRAKTMTKRSRDAGNFSHAKAYAAMHAMLIGMTTAGIVMTSELTK